MSCVSLATRTSTSTSGRRRVREWTFTRNIPGYKPSEGHRWRSSRLRSRLAHRAKRCRICRTARGIELHHTCGNTPDNMLLLCHRCHQTLHGAARLIMGRSYYGSDKLGRRTCDHCRTLRRAIAGIARRTAENNQ